MQNICTKSGLSPWDRVWVTYTPVWSLLIVEVLAFVFHCLSPEWFVESSLEQVRSRSVTKGQSRSVTKGQSHGGISNSNPVKVKEFWMGKFPVTQRQWKTVASYPSSTTTISGEVTPAFQGDNLPVEKVTYDQAQKFCQVLNEHFANKLGSRTFRLPNEEEWEYACRAGTTTTYYYGNSHENLEEYAWYNSNSGGKTHPVGQKKPNKWELYDILGNVWEYCVKPGSSDDEDDSHRMMCGGSWLKRSGQCS